MGDIKSWESGQEQMVREQAGGWGAESLHVWSNAAMLHALATIADLRETLSLVTLDRSRLDVRCVQDELKVNTAREILTRWRYKTGACPACHSTVHRVDCVLVAALDALAGIENPPSAATENIPQTTDTPGGASHPAAAEEKPPSPAEGT